MARPKNRGESQSSERERGSSDVQQQRIMRFVSSLALHGIRWRIPLAFFTASPTSTLPAYCRF